MKSPKIGVAIVILAAAAVLAVEGMLLFRDQAGERFWVTKDRAVNAMVDRLVFTDTAEAFRAGRMRNVALHDPSDEPPRITLDEKPQKGYPRDGTWTSGQVTTEFPITEVLPSWNVITPQQTGVIFHVRTRDLATAKWTPWLRIGSWGRVNDKRSLGRCEFGWIDEDTLRLFRPADAYEIRATLQSFGMSPQLTPAVRRIAVGYCGPVSNDSVWAKSVVPDPGPVESWARDLNVPYIPQGDNHDAVIGMTCSPTSVSMVLQHFGVKRPTMENCLAIWDDHNEMFGNWSNNTQRASELGMDAWLQRFRSWDQVKAMIAQGQPIIASIKFEPHTFPDSPVFDPARGTDGHLIVIRGFTRGGDVIVNDPGSRTKGNRAIFPAAGLAHAWFGRGGVGYVIRPPAKPLPAALVKAYPTAPAPTTSPTTAPIAAR